MSRDYDNSQGREHVVDVLSAYIDNALSSGERESVRAHLETCDSCQIEHEDLVGMKAMLKRLPVVPPPRAFTLTPEMVGAEARRGSFWQRLLTPRAVPRFATGSVVAFALLALLLVGDFVGTGSNTAALRDAPMSAPAPESSEFDMGTQRQTGLVEATVDAGATSVGGQVAPKGFVTSESATGGDSRDSQPTTAAGDANTTSGSNPGGVTAAQDPTGVAVNDTLDTSTRKQPQMEAAPELGYTPYSEDRSGVAVPALELALAAIGTALGIAALVARRRGV